MVKCINRKARTLLYQKFKCHKTSPEHNFIPMELCVLFCEINEWNVLRENNYVIQKNVNLK